MSISQSTHNEQQEYVGLLLQVETGVVGWSNSGYTRETADKARGKEAGVTVKQGTATGFSVLELLIVLAIAMVLTGMAIPVTVNAMRSYQLSAAVSAATGAIQSTRYAEIMQGFPGSTASPYGYEIIFTPATKSYQVYSMIPPATTYSPQVAVNGTTSPTQPVPITGSGSIFISRSATFLFAAGGTVTETSNPPNMVFSITDSFGGSKTITVSGVGNVTVTTP